MHLEIISPEAVLLSQNVLSVGVPGTAGSFQVLNNHAPIVSTLEKGVVKIASDQPVVLSSNQFHVENQGNYWTFEINSGVFEMRNNKAILLIE
ncbi:MAG: F0F1 ATP synthase subunit epsilon [Flavobacteriaceae bacterium]|nr:F0F1 ATP synthase subunit epsilon [Flavobacteriaceae bacterium]MCY4216902.1 F0F1 ATP synthase subunit epsilon [Flavobacteriaceae bacterium]MCY4253571.1 F0F1 ATP synthase subunit epsilon [Flavobacteriaceae bacterium]